MNAKGKAAVTGPAIVVVDDAPFFRHLLTDLLEDRGYRVLPLASGDEVADLIGRTEVAAVLTDIEMPGLAGPELLRRIKRLQPELPVIMISSHQDFQAAREVLRDGALDYLVKPIESEELFATVERAFGVYQASQKTARVEREARRRLSDLILLKEIGASASREDDLERFFGKLLDSIRDSAEVEIASLMLLEEDGLLHIRAARGLPGTVTQEARVATGEGISGHVLATGEAVLIEDITRDSRFAPSGGGDRYQTRSLLSVPISSRENVIGVLNVNNKRSGETFTAADEHLLTTIAHQTALAIENFQLVSSLRQQTRNLEDANRQLVRFQQARS
ncbi:MAG TPA: response regulator, partial [Desulfuromonadales bacterium]|nr:response regulator [Desulfuromonadales bacterium]